MRTKSTNLTLSDGIKKMGKEIVEIRHYSSLTVLVEELIRNKYEQLKGCVPIGKSLSEAPAASASSTIVEEKTPNSSELVADQAAKNAATLKKNPRPRRKKEDS